MRLFKVLFLCIVTLLAIGTGGLALAQHGGHGGGFQGGGSHAGGSHVGGSHVGGSHGGGFRGGGFHGGGFRGHLRGGVFIGAPLFWPWYYPDPYYYPGPYYYGDYAPVVESSPAVYIEQGAAPAAPEQSTYWYYCARSKGYYPYVQQCPGGWQRVAPQPPPAQ
jgi:hypothetical protein